MKPGLVIIMGTALSALAATSAQAIILGDFESGLDGWLPNAATLSQGTTGASTGTGAMQVTVPTGWRFACRLNIKPYRAEMGATLTSLQMDVMAFPSDVTSSMQLEFLINAQNNNDNGANNNLGWNPLGMKNIVVDGQPHTYVWTIGDTLKARIAATDTNIAWFELGINSNLSQTGPATRYYIDNVRLTGGQPCTGPDLAVNADVGRRPISPLIYGMNFADPTVAADTRLPVRRFGGNATTRYNWRLDAANHAFDWYFENLPEPTGNPGALPDGSMADRFVDQDRSTGTLTITTLPLIGWTPKSRAVACGFSVSKYGPQQEVDPWRPDCGNGIHPDGTPVTGNDPLDTSIAIDPTFVQDWIAHLIGRYGTAAQGGVAFYNLDNEPMLWNSTHRDVHPAPTTYDEMRDRTIEYASAIKAADPSAQTLGPVSWGWCAYFYSALDGCGRGTDYSSHGNTQFVPWYLQQMRTYEQQHGVRILDYLDLHCYPQTGVALTGAGDTALQEKRLRCTRALWDPTYVDEGWIEQPVYLIPRMRDWVNNNYPGTKLAITEYNWGAPEHVNGALAQADVLGIFGREGVDLAALWDPPNSTQPLAFAFRMYRNYDRLGGEFGEESVQATSADQGCVSVYAALRSGKNLTIMLVNKSFGPTASRLTITSRTALGTAAHVYRYSGADLTRIVREADLQVGGGAFDVALPASSITLLVIPRAQVQADFDADEDVDAADFGAFKTCLSGTEQPHDGSRICGMSDLDGDHDVDQSDFGIFQRCMSGAYIPADSECAG